MEAKGDPQMNSKPRNRRILFGVLFALIVLTLLVLLDVHGFANHTRDRW